MPKRTKPRTSIGSNRTGVDMSPIDSKMLINFANEMPGTLGSEAQFKELHLVYNRDVDPIGIGTVPIAGKRPEVLIDKLGERLAFERTGVRLYDAVLAQLEAKAATWESMAGGLTMEVVQRFRNEELQHFELVRQALESLGADSTAVTPGADVAGVQSIGVLQVITDPRSSAGQCIAALLTAELVDHDGWELLIHLADRLGLAEMATGFRKALDEETIHLDTIRQAARHLTLQDAKAA